jgi:hypothetical protein
MTSIDPAKGTLTTIAIFPKHYFLENIAVRSDGSILVTSTSRNVVRSCSPGRRIDHASACGQARLSPDAYRRGRTRHLLRMHSRCSHKRTLRFSGMASRRCCKENEDPYLRSTDRRAQWLPISWNQKRRIRSFEIGLGARSSARIFLQNKPQERVKSLASCRLPR